MKAPKEPSFSCPHLDEAISEIEKARSIHDELRKWGAWWESRCGELQSEHIREIEEKDKEISSLNGKLDDMADQIRRLENELSDLRVLA